MRSKKNITFIALIIGVLTFSGHVAAGTISGATGLITMGTADTLSQGSLELGLREYRDHFAVTALYGIVPDVEVGIHMPLADDKVDRAGLVIKGVITPETSQAPGVAIGFETDQSYVVASKRLAPRLRVHAAYLHGDVRGPAAGIAYTLSTTSLSRSGMPSPATTLLLEYTPEGVHAGARLLFGTLLSVDVGLLDLKRPTGGIAMQLAF